MSSQSSQTVQSYIYLFFSILVSFPVFAQCPDLGTNATLTSPDCVAGNTPCDLCPGDVMTLTATGTGILPGACVNWYYGTTSNFNPYNNEGTLMGCSQLEVTPPDPCGDCPIILSLFINACGTEQNNEYMVVWSASGFNVDEFQLNFDANNNMGAGNDDVGGAGACDWQTPSPTAIASVQTICTGATVVGVGPGQSVPPGVPVLIFTSANYDFGYNFGGLCPLAPVIYVMQNGCGRSVGAFTNTGSGTRTTEISQDCGCNNELTYDLGLLSNMNGDFVIWTPVIPVYGNLGCGFPSIPGLPGGGGSNPFSLAPFDYTVPASLCNDGPYWVVGVVEPLPSGCTQDFTNYIPFDVPCPPPDLGTATVCQFSGAFDLTQLEDPNVPGGGVWSGPGVSGNTLDPFGLSGTVNLSFIPNNTCSSPATTTIDVVEGVLATLTANGPVTVCAGGSTTFAVSFSGAPAPYTFEYAIDGTPQGPITTSDNPYIFTEFFTQPAEVSLASVSAIGCPGSTNGTVLVDVQAIPTAVIPSGSSTICAGDSLVLDVLLSGTAPFTFEYAIDGVTQAPPITTNNSLYFLEIFPPLGTSDIALVSVVDANMCPGQVFGDFTVTVQESPTAVLSGTDTVCFGQNADLILDFTGTPFWSVTYTINGSCPGNDCIYSTFDNPDILTITPDSTSVITLTGVVSGGGCVGTASGSGVIVIRPTPGAVLTGGSDTVCVNTPVSLQVNFSGTPPPYTFSYAVNGLILDTLISNTPTYALDLTLPQGVNTITLGHVTNGVCDGPVSGTYTLTVQDSVSAVLSASADTLCGGESVELAVNFTGTGPYSFTYTTNGQNPVNVQTALNPYTFIETPNQPTVYALTSVSAGGCNGTATGTAAVFVYDSLTAVISGGGQTCQGGTGIDIIFTFTGQGPYTFVYNAGVTPQPPITTSDSVYVITVNPPLGTLYTLASVTNGTCSGSTSGTALVFVFTPPTAEMLGNSFHCFQADTAVYVNFTGTGPFEYVYAINGVPQPPVTTFDDPDTIAVMTNISQVYSLVSISSPGCVGNIVGPPVTVTIQGTPTVANIVQNCDSASMTYTLSFQVVGGVPPYTLTCGAGTFTGNTFTSAPLPFSQPYQFCFLDSLACDTVLVADRSKCDCITRSGTMDLDTLTACVNGQVTAVFNNNAVLDANDTIGFILHDYTAFPYGNILAYNTTPTFNFLPGMQTGVLYRISAIVGNNNGMGQVDLNDSCLAVSPGVPLRFVDPPLLIVGSADTTCAGAPVLVPVAMSGLPPYTLSYTVNGNPPVSVPGLPGPVYDLMLTLTSTSQVLISIGDQNCVNPDADTVNIVVNQPPSWGIAAEACDQVNNAYTLTIPLTGTAPFVVSGLPGTVTGNTFTSTPIPFGQPYSGTLSDAAGCGLDTLTGTSACNCTNSAGTLDLTQPGQACDTNSVTVFHNGDQVLGADDVFYFVLHTGPGNTLGTVLDSSASPVFNYLPGVITFGTTYYVSAIVESGTISPDPCRSVSEGVPVVWLAPPTAVLSGNADICIGSSAPVTIVLTGTAPYNLTYSSNGNPVIVTANQSPFVINATLLDTTLFLPVSVTDANCPGTVSGSALITPHPIPQIQNVQISCAPGDSTYIVSFSVLNADFTGLTYTGAPAGTFTNGVFTSALTPVSTPFSYSVSDQWMCGSDTVSGTVVCCTTTSGTLDQTPLVLCNGDTTAIAPVTGAVLAPGDTLLYYLVDGTDPLTWGVLDIQATPAFAFDPATMSPLTAYFIVAVAGNQVAGAVDLNDPCLSITLGPEVLWQPAVSADLVLSADSICTGGVVNGQILLSGGTDYDLSYQVNGTPTNLTGVMGPVYNFTLNAPANGTAVQLLSVSSNGCTGQVNGNAQTIFVEPTFQITNLQTVCDNQQANFVLTFVLDNGPAPDPTYTVSGITGTLSGNTFTSNPQPVAAGYNLVVSTGLGCTQSASGAVSCVCTTDAGTISVSSATVCTNDTLNITLGGDAVLDPDDGLVYILYTNPADPLGSLVATSPQPQFPFLPGMSAGVPYFVSVVAGNQLPGGGVDTGDPCLSISTPPVQVQFQAPPTALFAGDTTVCPGSNVQFLVQFTGTAPFNFSYTLNGNLTSLVSPGPTFSISSSNIQQPQVYQPASVSDQVCAGTVSGSVTIGILPLPSVDLGLDQTVCNGDSAVITISLNNTDTASFTLNGIIPPLVVTNAVNGQTITVTPVANTVYFAGNVTALNNSCAPIPGDSADIRISTLSGTLTTSDFNGFGVSCDGLSDGQITLNPVGGVPPLSAVWDNGSTGLTLTGQPAGSYTVTLSDAAGCRWTDSVALLSPQPITPDLTVQNAGCTGDENGAIVIDTVLGGVGPFVYTLDGTPLSGNTASNLPPGTYTLEVTDANGCAYETDIDILTAPPLILEAGPDVTVSLGDQVVLNALANSNALVSIVWTPDNSLSRSNELRTVATPTVNTQYVLTIVDANGCTATDSLLAVVINANRIYIPNAFRPNVENGNERFLVFAGPEVSIVRRLQVYDRWGETVFEGVNLIPNEVNLGWDGNWRGDAALPGVYIYVAEIEFTDGTTTIRSGDVTIVR